MTLTRRCGRITHRFSVIDAELFGLFGLMAKGLASFIALGSAVLCVPVIAYLTTGKYYIARQPEKFRRLWLLTVSCVNGTMSLLIWRVAQPITVRFALYAVH